MADFVVQDQKCEWLPESSLKDVAHYDIMMLKKQKPWLSFHLVSQCI